MSTKPRPLRELFEAALELPPEAREVFLGMHCADADEVDRLRRMLQAAPGPQGALPDLEAIALAEALPDEVHASALPHGSRIGSFELLDVLGEGGSSTVFRARRTSEGVQQDVALKLLRRGLYSPDAQRQFRSERRALAQLRHPGIARLIEGGITDDGLAYIALDLVEGVPITTFTREHRLDFRSRLRLFLDVCLAVDAAHRALIVHRDLKPSNVLVTDDGAVKLLDFGIAKLLDADDETQTRLPAFTPAYASPEQRAGGQITTATDVYSLGILLGELMTGVRIKEGSTNTPSSQISGEQEAGVLPAAANVTRRQLRGDLDNIVMKAIDVDPSKRYASAGAFADDIERLLDGRAVAAHPQSSWYRARKFVGRHRGGVMTTAALLLLILAGLGMTLWQARIAREEASRANVVRDFLVSVFQSAGADLPKDKQPSADELVEQATNRLMEQNGLSDATRADLLMVLSKVSNSANAFDRALGLLDRSEPLIDRIYAPADPHWLEWRVTRATALDGKNQDAAIIALLEPLKSQLLSSHDAVGLGGIGVLGMALSRAGPPHVEEALELFSRARESAANQSAKMRDAYLTLSIQEADSLIYLRRFREGLDRSEAAIALWKQNGSPLTPHIGELYSSVALGAEAMGDMPRAEAAYKTAIELDHRFYDKPSPRLAWDVGIYGSFLVSQGRYEDAEPPLREGLELRKTVFGESDPGTLFAYTAMGRLFAGEGRFADAETWYGEGIHICEATALKHKVCPQLLSLRSDARSAMGHLVQAEDDVRRALAAQTDGTTSAGYGFTLKVLVELQVLQHRYNEAIASADQALAISKSLKGGMIQADLDIRYWRARALFALDRRDEALSEIIDVEPKFASLFPNNPSRFGMLLLKARALNAAGQPHAAAKAAADALALPPMLASREHDAIPELRHLAAQD
jgi:serine/threonine protein kinase